MSRVKLEISAQSSHQELAVKPTGGMEPSSTPSLGESGEDTMEGIEAINGKQVEEISKTTSSSGEGSSAIGRVKSAIPGNRSCTQER